MRIRLIIIFVFLSVNLSGQSKNPEDYGFRHLQILYKCDTVEVLVKSKAGEENKVKPLFLFCQGSLPKPLIIYDDKGVYGVFPFNPDILTNDYHVAIVGKPYIPVVSDAKLLRKDFTYLDDSGNYPRKYSERNLLDYYVNRNINVIKYLQKQKWISKNMLIVAGHSEGSTIAAKLAFSYPRITHLIYSGGNPMGRIMSVITQERSFDRYSDSSKAEEELKNWQNIVDNRTNMDTSHGDTYMATFDFSVPPIKYLEKLNIPILICYGTKDWCTPFNDFLRVDMSRKRNNNFSFLTYIGTEHNYFPLWPDGKPNYDIFNWDKVVKDWLNWLEKLKYDKYSG